MAYQNMLYRILNNSLLPSSITVRFCFRLPLTYILPEFPEDIKRRLTNKREGVKNHETSTNTIITIIYQDMLKFLGDNP